MKKINTILGLLLFIGPFSFIKVCDFSKKIMHCTYSAIIVSCIGLCIICLSSISKKVTRVINYYFTVLLYLMAIIVPRFVIGGCKSVNMKCNTITFPSVYMFVIVGIVCNVVFLIKYRIENKECTE